MRPKKRILIWGATAVAGSILRVVMEARGYAVELAATEDRLWQAEEAPDAVLLVGFDAAGYEALEQRVWRGHRGVGVAHVAARGVVAEEIWIAGLLDAIRRVTLRKRGPKCGMRPTAPPADAEAAA